MIVLHITIASAIFSVMFAYRNYWQIKELNVLHWIVEEIGDEPRFEMQYYKAKWHKWQFALQIYIGVIITLVSFACDFSLLNSFGHGLLFGSVFWLVFDTLLGYLLTNNLLHVDSNGIGNIYKNIAFSILDIIWKINVFIKRKRYTVDPLIYNLKGINLAGYLLLISKLLFFTISIILSLI